MPEEKFRKAEIRFKDQLAGILLEGGTGYQFTYDPDFIRTGIPISVSLPLRTEPFKSRELFSFFEGLLPEGWYLNIVSSTAKVDEQDSFGILLATSGGTMGAISIHKSQ